MGKTTFAKQLERNLPAIRFTHDEWMVSFYGSNPPAHLFPAYSGKVTEQISLLGPRCLELGMDVVLDLGFWIRQERDEARATAENIGASVVIRPGRAAPERLTVRNQSLDGDLVIFEATYELLKRRFEPLELDEARMEVEG